MIGFTSRPINFTYSSIPLEPISDFNKNEGYVLGSIRKYNNNIYVALDDIPKTVNHIWNDTDPLNIYGYDLYLDAKIPDPTNVYVENGVTLVYVLSNKHYYRAKHTGYVDYTAENPVTPTYFDDLGTNPTPLYRTKLEYPNGKKDTFLWGYQGVLNRYIMTDEVIDKQTINDRSFTTTGTTTFSNTGVITLASALPSNIYLNDKIKISGTTLNDGYYKISLISTNRLTITLDKLTVSETVTTPINIYTQTYIKWNDTAVNRLAFFNTECEKIEVKVTVAGNTTTYSNDMIDTSFINTFELFCFNEPKTLFSTIFEIYPNYSQEFEVTFFGNTQKIGEVIQGIAIDLGIVEDSMDLNGRVYATITEAENGDLYVDENITQNDILERKSFTMVVETNKINYFKDNIKAILGKKVVLSGSSFDKDDFKILLTYGFIRENNFKPKIKDDYSTYTFEIREFKEWQS